MDLFTRLARRALLREETVRPVVPPLFAPMSPGWQGTTPEMVEMESAPTRSSMESGEPVRLPESSHAAQERDDRSRPVESPQPAKQAMRSPDPHATEVTGSTASESVRPESHARPPVTVVSHPVPAGKPTKPREQAPTPPAREGGSRTRAPEPAPAAATAPRELQARPDGLPRADASLKQRQPEPAIATPPKAEPAPSAAIPAATPPRRARQSVLGLRPVPERRESPGESVGIPQAPNRRPLRAPRVDSQPMAPPIHVHIGRVEVRAVLAQPPAASPRRSIPGPLLSLNEYLESGNRGRKGNR